MLAGSLLLGFLGAVHVGCGGPTAPACSRPSPWPPGTLLTLIWPYAGVLHDVALDAAADGHRPAAAGRLGRRRAVLAGLLRAAAAVLHRRDRARAADGRGARRTCSASASRCCRSAWSAPRPSSPAPSSRSLALEHPRLRAVDRRGRLALAEDFALRPILLLAGRRRLPPDRWPRPTFGTTPHSPRLPYLHRITRVCSSSRSGGSTSWSSSQPWPAG